MTPNVSKATLRTPSVSKATLRTPNVSKVALLTSPQARPTDDEERPCP
jgi:hypothetical protein